jgi:hypothetical protein
MQPSESLPRCYLFIPTFCPCSTLFSVFYLCFTNTLPAFSLRKLQYIRLTTHSYLLSPYLASEKAIVLLQARS